MSLLDAARELLHEALRGYAGSARAASWLRRQLQRLDEPLRVAVAGPPGSGKTTLADALAGERRRSRALRELDIVDTAGDAPPAAVCADADAVLYLIRTKDGRELDPLRAAFDHPAAAATPVAVIAVLSRTDELGGGRIDALTSGRRLARRYRRDALLPALCQDVVAVAGLVALAGRTLTAADFAAVSALARLPRTELDAALLSADRFVRTDLPALPWADGRQALLDRFGVSGLRLATTLLRTATGTGDQAWLQAELAQRSGLGELRESMRLFFLDRPEVLKARSALLAVDSVLRAEPHPAATRLAAALERVLAGAHEFRELRLLSALHAGRVPVPEELAAEAVRITGGYGDDVLSRLGIETPAGDDAQVRHAVLATLDRWLAYAADPRAPAEVRRAARVVVRSCEGMLARSGGVLDRAS